MSAVEVRHLQALVALTEEGTFTDAAIRLGVTQSAVSRTIGSLEDLLSSRLVERTTRSVALTPAGARCYRAAVQALVAIVRGEFSEPGTTTRRLFAEPRMAVLPDGHRLAGASSVQLADLIGDTVLTTAYGTTTLELWPVGHRPARSLRVDNTDEWLTEIAGGLAIGVTAESTAVQHPHPGVVFIPISDGGTITVQLTWPSGHAHPAVTDFVASVEQVVAGATTAP